MCLVVLKWLDIVHGCYNQRVLLAIFAPAGATTVYYRFVGNMNAYLYQAMIDTFELGFKNQGKCSPAQFSRRLCYS